MEGTFLGFEEKVVFSQVFQDLCNMVAMFAHAPEVYEDIMNVDEDKPMEILLKHLVDEILEHGGGVVQAIGHNEIFVVASRGHKSCLPLVPLMYPDEVISALEVQLGKDSGSAEMF